MRKFYFLLTLILLVSSCQLTDDDVVVDDSFTLDGTSSLTESIKNLTQNSTTFDNFIDGTSKVRIELPYDITVNDSIDFALNDVSDYQNLIEVLEATPIQDEIDLVFPVNVSGIDHNMVNIASKTDLDLLLEELPESTAVNCLNLAYPIKVQFFNSISSQISDQDIFNDAQLFNFLDNLISEGIFYQFEYPIVATTGEDTETVINSNDEFSALYSNLPNFCLNTVIYDNVESSFNPEDVEIFTNFITTGDFTIDDFLIDDEEIFQFDNAQLSFEQDFRIFNNETQVGDWQIHIANNAIVFELMFDDIYYEKLEKFWYVMTLNENTSQLSDVSAISIISRLELIKD